MKTSIAIGALALAVIAGSSQAAITNSSTAMFDYTTLPGYGVATSSVLNFSNDGWGGWSVPTGKVALGAVVTALGGQPLSVSAPALPGTAYPHYTYGAGEYGWVVRNGSVAQQVQISVFYADPVAGYTISKSSQLNYNGAGGYGGSLSVGIILGRGFGVNRQSVRLLLCGVVFVGRIFVFLGDWPALQHILFLVRVIDVFAV